MPRAGGVLLVMMAVLLAGCSGQGGLLGGLGLAGGDAPTPCLDDSKDCIEQRMARLKAMLDDKSRSWVNEQPTPQSYASGVRLFAYRATKSQLDCRELHAGTTETQKAKATLASTHIPGLAKDQLAKVKALNDQVHEELAREYRRVCKSPKAARKGFESRNPRSKQARGSG